MRIVPFFSRWLVFLTVSFLAIQSAHAKPAPFTVEDAFELELATDPQISPDGRQVVYVRQFVDTMEDQRRSNLWIVATDGSDHRPLTTGNTSDAMPRWSPDGTSLAYVSDAAGSPQIHRRWMDTGTTAKLTDLATPPGAIAWSPDGELISFVTLVSEVPLQVKGLPAPPPGATWAPPATITDRFVYRFNGAGYLPRGHTHVFVVPATGGTPRQISSGQFDHGAIGLVGQLSGPPVWSADGASLLVSVNRRDDPHLEPLDTEIVEYTVVDGASRALTDRRGPDNAPVVSPDGRHVTWLGFDDRHQGYQPTELWVMSRNGNGKRSLTADLDRDVSALGWSPDSRTIYFTSNDAGTTGLWAQTLEGSRRRIANGLGSSLSAYGGGAGLSVAQNVIATTVTNPYRPGDVALTTPRGRAPRVITDVNGDLLGGRTLGEVEEIRWASSKDGREVQGWILKPPGFDPVRKYPLVLEIHGGPFADYGPRFDLEKQLFAAAGYVVLYANPRGSTSYGQTFGNLIHHAYPGDDLHDLLSGVDAVIARDYVDTDALMVTGGSGGGVLTCWVIGHTDRFRAAATIYPVINWASFVLTSDVGAFASRYWFPGLPWDHVEHYWQRSLLSVVKNVRTPTLVMVGEEDWRTPPSEAEQYYQALKLLGVESELVRVPGEPHGIARHPSHHAAKVLAIIDWFDRHRNQSAPSR